MAPRWTPEETYDLGYLVGMGLSGPAIAEVMGRSLGTVSMRLLRLRKRLTARRDGSVVVPVELSPKAKRVFDECAAFRGQQRQHVIERLCQIVGEEGELFLENLLDDEL